MSLRWDLHKTKQNTVSLASLRRQWTCTVQELAHFFYKEPDGEWFRLWEPRSLGHDCAAPVAGKQPQAVCKRTGVAAFQTTFLCGHEPRNSCILTCRGALVLF